jgi:hypothetical protein
MKPPNLGLGQRHKVRIFGTSRSGEKGCELMFGAFVFLAFLGVLGGSLHNGYDKSELFVIFCSLALALYYLSRIIDWRRKHSK